MATYVIGDVHGCAVTLGRLLERVGFSVARDQLWLVGDLVNRGPASLAVLRWAYSHREAVTMVLGNHDLHLLARAIGARERGEDTLGETLAADDAESLLGWLRRRPLVHFADGTLLVHAGLVPEWGLDETLEIAAEVETRLADDDGLAELYRLRKTVWRRDLVGDHRLAAALAVMTRIRVVDRDGRPRLGFTAPPAKAPPGCRPWFETSRVVAAGYRVVFGHWARLGYHRHRSAVCLDSACQWGGTLTALRLDDGRVFAEPVAPVERAAVPGDQGGEKP